MKCVENCEFIEKINDSTYWCDLYDKVLLSVKRKDDSDCIIRCKKCEERDINTIKMFLVEIDNKCNEIHQMKTRIESILRNINYD